MARQDVKACIPCNPAWRASRPLFATFRVSMAIGTCLLSCLLPLSSCRSHRAYHNDVSALYALTTLSADLPDETRVPAIIAAADHALRSRGYAVTHRSSTLDTGRVIAEAHGSTVLERVVVTASITSVGHRVTITCQPIGDEAASRAILDAILTRLNL